MRLTDTTARLLAGSPRRSARPASRSDPDDAGDRHAAPAAGFIRSTLRTTTNPTGLTAGYKHNVIPDTRRGAHRRAHPARAPRTPCWPTSANRRRRHRDRDRAHRDIGLEVPFDGPLVDAMVAALGAHDPGVPVHPVPDGRRHRQQGARALGIAGYGFAPLRLPADLDFTGMFHGVDERVPLDALVFGQAVLTDLLCTTDRSTIRRREARTKGHALEAIILGLVQGLTEFLPISSSAHLRILGEFLARRPDPGAAFTAITQLGTESGGVMFFWRDIVRIISHWFRSLAGRVPRNDPDARMGWLIIVGTHPDRGARAALPGPDRDDVPLAVDRRDARSSSSASCSASPTGRARSGASSRS